MSKTTALFLYTETSLHAGTGAMLSYFDLPIQRETHTGHPIIYPSGVKGALRELCQGKANSLPAASRAAEEAKINAIFGPAMLPGKTEAYGGLAIFKEARVALFPVRSFQGTFAWVTSPMVLARLMRDLVVGLGDKHQKVLDLTKTDFASLRPVHGEKAAFCTNSSLLVNGTAATLEDFCFNDLNSSQSKEATNKLAAWFSTNCLPSAPEYSWWRAKLATDLVVVSDNDFDYFVKVHTEIQTHVKIGDNGVVASTGPWNEECLPPDTLLYSMFTVPAPQAKETLLQFKTDGLAHTALRGWIAGTLQMCGDRSLGKGLVRPVQLN